MSLYRPIIGITMGDPVGVGPEIIHLSLRNPGIYKICRPVVLGDTGVLENAKKSTKSMLGLHPVNSAESGKYACGEIDVIPVSDLGPEKPAWGSPTDSTGRAMIDYINSAADMALKGQIVGMVTCPINKAAMEMAGSRFHGHTELLAERTRTDKFVMMFIGSRLRVVLVTIHIPLKAVPNMLSTEKVLVAIEITNHALKERFGIGKPCMAVAALNPHAGEGGMFGDEEENIIQPAIDFAREKGIYVKGPFPPDTIFHHAVDKQFDAVVCMYHDQGLIPFKMLHFKDGVNTTLGLPIIRTSVDHGTAYDIAGTGKADPGSLIAAIESAAQQAVFVNDY